MIGDPWGEASARALLAVLQEPGLALGREFDAWAFARHPWRELAERIPAWVQGDDRLGPERAIDRLRTFLNSIADEELEAIGVKSRGWIAARALDACGERPLGDPVDELARVLEAHDDASTRRAVTGEEPGSSGGDGFMLLSEVKERPIRWYWPGRIAEASVVLIAGDGGVGKSTFAQDLAARMTRGEAPPGGEAVVARSVVILSAEEDAEAIIRPRMRLMRADLTRVVVLDPDQATIKLPENADQLEARCRAEDAGLVIIDVGPAFLGQRLKSISEEDIRRFFAPLRAIAERLRVVVVVVAHLNKNTTAGAQQRIMGGVAWRNAARQVLIVGPPPGQDPRETGERLVAVEKNNYTPGPFAPAHAFRLAAHPEEPSWAVVAWGSEIEGIRPDDLVRSAPNEEERTARDDAVEFLAAALRDGDWHDSATVKQAARREDISDKPLRAARKDLGVEIDRRGRGAEHSSWWRLPGSCPTPNEVKDRSSEGTSEPKSESPDGERHSGSPAAGPGSTRVHAQDGGMSGPVSAGEAAAGSSTSDLVARMQAAGLAPVEESLPDPARTSVETLHVGEGWSAAIERPRYGRQPR